MVRLRLATCMALVLTLWGCAIFETQETTFLRSAQDRATQQEVRQRLGVPNTASLNESGGSVWVYHVWDWQPGNRITAPGAWCDEYVLRFDNQSILRNWTYRSQFHGGEAFPTQCVKDRPPAS